MWSSCKTIRRKLVRTLWRMNRVLPCWTTWQPMRSQHRVSSNGMPFFATPPYGVEFLSIPDSLKSLETKNRIVAPSCVRGWQKEAGTEKDVNDSHMSERLEQSGRYPITFQEMWLNRRKTVQNKWWKWRQRCPTRRKKLKQRWVRRSNRKESQ